MTMPTKEELAGYTESDLYELLHRVNEAIKEASESAIDTDQLRSFVTAELGNKIGVAAEVVAFGTSHWDDGYFYTEDTGSVVLQDGTIKDFRNAEDRSVNELMSDLSYNAVREDGALNDRNAVIINLKTGKVEYSTWYQFQMDYQGK